MFWHDMHQSGFHDHEGLVCCPDLVCDTVENALGPQLVSKESPHPGSEIARSEQVVSMLVYRKPRFNLRRGSIVFTVEMGIT